MTNRLSRRKFLGAIGLATTGLAGLAMNSGDENPITIPAYAQTIPNEAPEKETPNEDSEIKYTIIARRTLTKAMGMVKTVRSEYGVDSRVWEALPKGLTKKEFYDSIINVSVNSSTTTLLKGVVKVHPGPIDNEDLLKEFMTGADRYIENPHPGLDPKLEFTKQDKKTLEKLLRREIKSPLTGTRKLSFFGSEKQVYLFPPQSIIGLKAGNGAPSIELKVNLNPDITPVKYNGFKENKVTDEEEQRVFDKFRRFMILTEDPALPKLYGKEIKRPIDNFYRTYTKEIIFR